MTLPSLPTDLLVLCVEPSNGRPRRACRALCAAFDELAREKGVDLVLRGWRNTSRVVASVVPLESLGLHWSRVFDVRGEHRGDLPFHVEDLEPGPGPGRFAYVDHLQVFLQ